MNGIRSSMTKHWHKCIWTTTHKILLMFNVCFWSSSLIGWCFKPSQTSTIIFGLSFWTKMQNNVKRQLVPSRLYALKSVRVYVHAWVHTHKHIHLHVCMYSTHTHTHMQCIHTCMSSHADMNKLTHTHTHIHTHTHTHAMYTHMHEPTCIHE